MADVSFVSAAQAKEIDEKLMGPEFGFSIDQLMELAGLSVASALCEVYPPRSYGRVLVLCGPRVLLETAEGMVEDWLQSWQ